MIKKMYNFTLPFILLAIGGLFILACEKEGKDVAIELDKASLTSLIQKAESLAANSEEGMQPGLYIAGAIEALEGELQKAKTAFDSATTEEEISDAAKDLQAAITLFQTKKLREAVPYIKQKSGACIKISESIKYTINNVFTVELDCYFLDLQPISFSNNIITCEQMQPVVGFTVRSFADGSVEIVVGHNQWYTAKSEPGILEVGEWVHVAFTSTKEQHKLYIDGEEVLTLNAPRLSSNIPLRIGSGQNYPGRVMNGMVKDLRVWNTIRTIDEIRNYKDLTLEGNEKGLKAFFPLNIDLGREFKDLKGFYTAYLIGDVELVFDGGLPEIVLNYSAIDASLNTLNKMKTSVVEGDEEGQYPEGTLELINGLILRGQGVKNDAQWQKEIDIEVNRLNDAVDILNNANKRTTTPPTGKYSAIFGAGTFSFDDEAVIYDIKHSGFTTVIIWTIHIAEDGSMAFNLAPVIDKDGNYIGGAQWGDNIAKLLQAPTTIDRIELGIGAWGATSWGNIKKMIDRDGTGPETKLYKNIKTLVDITGATAINFDDELTYDVESTVAFSLMLNAMGLKVGLCPYTRTSYWQSVYQQVEAKQPGSIDRVYLQCYAGGAGNTPSVWNSYFGDLKVSMGLWSKHGNGCLEGKSPAQIATNISTNKECLDGGFIWLYDDIKSCTPGQTKAYSDAINTSFE